MKKCKISPATLARTAAANYPGAYLAQCTLVTT